MTPCKILWLSPESLAGRNPQQIWSEYVKERGNFDVTYDKNDDYDIVFFTSDSVLDEELIGGDRYTIVLFWDFLSPRLVQPDYMKFVQKQVSLMKKCNLILVPTYVTRSQAFTLGMPAVICYPGIDSKRIDDAPAQKKEHQICAIGRLVPYKQFDWAIRAASAMDPKPKVVVIGAGDGAPLERLAGELGVECRIGPMSDEEKFTEIKKSVCFVSPTHNEGFDMPVLEAAYAGVPVLALDTPTHREILKEYAVYFSSPDDLAEKMAFLSSNEGLRGEMSRRGREYVKDNLTFDKAAERLERVLGNFAKHGVMEARARADRTKQGWTDAQEEIYSKREFGKTGRALKEAETPDGKEYINILLKHIGEPPKKVLDVACNDGSITKFLKDRGYDAIGVDLPKVVERAKKLNPDCDLRALDVDVETDNAPQFRDTFDGIYAGSLIEHLIHDVPFLRRMRSYLKIGGTIVLTTGVSPESTDRPDAAHIRFYTQGSLRNIMAHGCGFEVTYTGDIKEDNAIVVVGRK